jgi:hypothetical protein
MKHTKPIGDPPVIYEITDVHGFVDALRAHLGPVFAEQEETWKREGPGAEARAAALGITIETCGGNCPVQAEGSFDAKRFYFRARYDAWQFHIWSGDQRYLDVPFGEEELVIERDYGDQFDAGRMHKHEAIGFICDSVEEYRKGQANG